MVRAFDEGVTVGYSGICGVKCECSNVVVGSMVIALFEFVGFFLSCGRKLVFTDGHQVGTRYTGENQSSPRQRQKQEQNEEKLRMEEIPIRNPRPIVASFKAFHEENGAAYEGKR
jgi:hypothetical protein